LADYGDVVKRFAVTLLAGLLALTLAPGMAEAKKKPGPPPGATTKQIQGWVTDALKGWYTCSPTDPTPCTLTLDWSRIRWMGTKKMCVQSFFGSCLDYATVHVARTSILVTTATQRFDYQGNPTYIFTQKYRYGYWDRGRKEVKYRPWPGGAPQSAACEDCGKDLYVRKGDFGRWFFGFGPSWYYLKW
jgi:hypothetical protein